MKVRPGRKKGPVISRGLDGKGVSTTVSDSSVNGPYEGSKPSPCTILQRSKLVSEEAKQDESGKVVLEAKDRTIISLSESEKAKLRREADKLAHEEIKKQLEEAFLAQAKMEAMQALKPLNPEDEIVSFLVDLPDMTGLLTDGRLFQHGRVYNITRTQYDDLRARQALAWRCERELNNPFSGSKWYRPATGYGQAGGAVLRGGEGVNTSQQFAHRY